LKKYDQVDNVKIDSQYVVWQYMAAICQIGFTKEMYLEHSTHGGSQSSTYPPNFIKICYLGQRYVPIINLKPALWRQNLISGFGFDNFCLSGTFLCIIEQNFKKIAQHTAELLRFNFSLQDYLYTPTAQRHSAGMQAIYKKS